MANLSNINNKFIVTDGGNVLIGQSNNSSGRLQIKDTQTSSFNDGLAITRNNAAQTGYINMVGGAFNFNSPGLSYKFRNNGTQTLELNSSGNATFAGDVIVGSTNPVKLIDQSYGGELGLYYGTTNHWKEYHYSDNSLRFNYNGSGGDELIIDTSGNATFSGTLQSGNFAIGVAPSSFGSGVPTITLKGTAANGRGGAIVFKELDGTVTTNIYSTDGADGYGTVINAAQGSFRVSVGALAANKLEITSNGSIYNGLASNTHFGLNALSSVTTADESTAFGNNALGSQQTGRNTAVGFHTLQDLTTGQYNTAVGGEAAENIIDGSFNVSVGSFSLRQNTSGSENTAIGYQSLSNNTTQSKLTALGYRAGYFWTAGNENTFIGHQAGFGTSAASTGGENTLVGSLAGASSAGITGSGNTSIGRFTLNALSSGSFNTALGHQSGISITTGNANTLVGKNSGVNIGSASRNSVLGQSAGQALTTASDNVAIGYEALFNQVSNGQNIAIGVNALYSYTGTRTIAIGYNAGKNFASNVDCVFIGQQAGELRTAGIDNTFVGAYANYAGGTGCCNTGVGKSSGYSLTSGVQNTFLGRQAGYSVTSDNNNTLIGHNTGLFVTGGQNTFIGSGAGDAITTGSHNNIFGYNCEASSVSGTDQIVIGTNGQLGKGNSTGFISPGTGGVFQGNNNTTWSNTSDERIKKNIVDNNKGLEIINKIQIRNFEYRTEDEITDFENPKSAVVNKEGIQLGVIAQEIEKILPETITEESTGVKTLNSDNLTWYLINAVKELKAEIELLKNK